MSEKNNKIQELQDRTNLLIDRQNKFIAELKQLRAEVKRLKEEETITPPKPVEKQVNIPDFKPQPKEEVYVPSVPNVHSKAEPAPSIFNFDFEKFIGENLISKLGILITVIGVIIGAKYSIDNNLINPVTRIILGYIMGIGLMGFGIKLKEKYENYSAVLVSGAIAIMYFITFAAYSFYDIFPQWVAFLLMVMFTIFTVIAAINYDKQVIAHIGLVGAYAVPFFLSSGSGNMLVFFSYITIINIGILAIAYQKYWKKLYYAAFGQTWLIYLVWYVAKADMPEQFGLALAFATVFFILFYLTFLAYNVAKKEKFSASTIVIILLNAFIYYGIGFSILEQHATGSDYLGLFTLVNALMHFCVGIFIKEQKLHDEKLFYLAVGLVLVFVTMAIPVQLDGNWVTLLWTGQAALLFWIGRTKKVPFYELFSYALMLLSFLSLCEDWTTGYYAYPDAGAENAVLPIFNVQFLTSILFVAAFAFINKINHDTPDNLALQEDKSLQNFLTAGLFGLLVLSIYMAFRVEVDAYFTHLYESTRVGIKADDSERISYSYNYDLRRLKEVWLLNYTAIFLIILSIINLRKLKSNALGYANVALNGLVIFAILTYGIYELSSLHYNYFNPPADNVFSKSVGYIVIRYLSFSLLGGLFFMTYQYLKERFSSKLNWVIFDLILYIAVLTIISSEFLNWLNTFGAGSADTLTITIIWGIYALIGVGIGIWKKKQHLRIGAFVLFGFTLVKLFFYDISHLDTISKTVVLVSLGVLLLVISFLYNKYKNLIFEEDKPTIDED